MRINDVILEIKNYRNTSIHKSALDIFRLLETNKVFFVDKMDNDNFNHLLNGFENLSYANPKEYVTSSYQRDFQTHYDLLVFYLDKIV